MRTGAIVDDIRVRARALTVAWELPAAPWRLGSWTGICSSAPGARAREHVSVVGALDDALIAPCGPRRDTSSCVQAILMRAAPEMQAALAMIAVAETLAEAREIARTAGAMATLAEPELARVLDRLDARDRQDAQRV